MTTLTVWFSVIVAVMLWQVVLLYGVLKWLGRIARALENNDDKRE